MEQYSLRIDLSLLSRSASIGEEKEFLSSSECCFLVKDLDSGMHPGNTTKHPVKNETIYSYNKQDILPVQLCCCN